MLKTLRKKKKLTQQQLADLCGLRQNYISVLERYPEKNNPTVLAIVNLSKALDIDKVDLFLYFAEKK